jgi:hypothetical protein
MAIVVLGVTSATDVSNLQADGIMGMAPTDQTRGTSALFMESLVSAGIISENKFGVDYRDTTNISKITLGGFDTSVVANESLFTWVNLRETFYWDISLTEVKYNDTSINLNARRGILDTGASLTLFETADFNIIWAEITRGKECGFSSATGLRACICTSINDFKPINLTFGSYQTSMALNSFINFVDNGGTRDLCEFYIGDISVSLGAPFVLLGDSFLRNYYIYHDAVNQRVGFVLMLGAYLYGTATYILPFLVIAVNLL